MYRLTFTSNNGAILVEANYPTKDAALVAAFSMSEGRPDSSYTIEYFTPVEGLKHEFH